MSRRPRRFASLPYSWRYARTRIGLALVLLVVAVALLGPLFAGPTTDFVGAPFAAPSEVGPFGTDVLGRDVLARYLSGGRSTLVVAVTATALGVGVGALIGLGTALSSKRLSRWVSRALDLALVFPVYVLILVFVAVFGGGSVVFVIAIAYIPIVGRVIRSAALEVVRREYVQYARLLGMSRWAILRRELLPNVTGPLSVEAGLRLTYAIAMSAALSYLGFGPAPPAPDWGAMISENQVGLQVQPWGVLLPVLTIAVLTIGTNLIAEGFAAASARRTGHGAAGDAGAAAVELGATRPTATTPARDEPGVPEPAQRVTLEQS
jgi:peptide/nickel transport system permease protein